MCVCICIFQVFGSLSFCDFDSQPQVRASQKKNMIYAKIRMFHGIGRKKSEVPL